MPRKIATQVDQSLSRLLKGGYLKQTPLSYPTMLAYPPAALPARTPMERSGDDALSSTSSTQAGNAISSDVRRNPLNSKKRSHSLMPKLSPQPIVYLADRIRLRFYQDHPWETFRPRTLVEGLTLQDVRVPHPEATDMTAWGRNPSPEDVVACTIHLHKKHSLSLSQAYHHALSSYHALRAEHEHASRSAVLEARAYGAVFAVSADGSETAAVEIERGYRRESEELEKGAAYFKTVFAGTGAAEGEASVADTRKGALRVKSSSAHYSQGQLYLKKALEARDGMQDKTDMEQQSKSAQESQAPAAVEHFEENSAVHERDSAMVGSIGQPRS